MGCLSMTLSLPEGILAYSKRVVFNRLPVSLRTLLYPSPPLPSADRRLIALHGWGANAQDLASLAPYLDLKNCQYCFPDGPMPHPQAPNGRMWYDLSTQEGLESSRQQLTDWIQSPEAIANISLSNTVLAGFSQGGAMTLDVGTHLPLAGLIVLSGYLHPLALRPLPQDLPPILMIHGRQDTVVPLEAAQFARDTLTQAGATVEYHEFDMGHEIQPQVLTLMQDFINQLKIAG
jgi:phospholipase/carboxylesterase